MVDELIQLVEMFCPTCQSTSNGIVGKYEVGVGNGGEAERGRRMKNPALFLSSILFEFDVSWSVTGFT